MVRQGIEPETDPADYLDHQENVIGGGRNMT